MTLSTRHTFANWWISSPVPQCVFQGFEGYIDADLVAVLETIGNCLRDAIYAERNAFNGVRHDSLGERFTGKANDAEGWRFQRWTACFVVYCDPDLIGVLGREVMKPERGKEANHGMRNDFCHDGERMMLTDRRFSESVYASRRPTQQTLPI